MFDRNDTDPETEGVHVLNTTALAGFLLSGAVGALALFSIPFIIGNTGDTIVFETFGQFRRVFITICIVEGAAAMGVLLFGMRLYQPGPDVETDGGHE